MKQNPAYQRAVEILREGIPINATADATRQFIERCEAVLEEIGSKDSLISVKIRSSQLVAATQLPTTQADLNLTIRSVAEISAMAERLDDDVARAYARLAWGFSHPAPEHTDERVRAAREILGIATQHTEATLVPPGYVLLLFSLLEQGEIRSLDIELLQRRTETFASRDPHQATVVSWFRCLRSILDGDTQSAEKQANDMLAEAELTDADSLALHTTQMGMIRWMQGRFEGLEDGFLAARRAYPEHILWPASLAWLWLLQGRRSAGEALLESLPDLYEIPRDRYWLSTMTVLAEIARSTGSRERAEQLRSILLPFADHLVPVGIGVAFWGTCARTLGLLEEYLGLLDEARSHLELAVELSNRIGAIAWHAEAQIELAEFAIRHHIVEIPAYELLDEARAASESRGFAALARRAMYRPRIRVLGTFEVISVCGVKADWTSKKARELLKMLIASRGVATSREVFMDILWPGERPESLGNRFSVAINVIRRALDPNKLMPTQHYVVTEGDSVRLAIDHLDIDLERFLALAKKSDDASRQAARQIYRGDAFSADIYSDWAARIREHVKNVRSSLNREEPQF